MVPSVSRRSVLQAGGAALAGAVAGCSELSTEEEPPTVPIFLENRDTAHHNALVEVHSTTEEAAFTREDAIAPDEIVKVDEVTVESFCLRGRLLSGGLAETCPTRGKEDYSQNGFMIVIRPSLSSAESERRIEIVPIQDADGH